MAGCFKIVDNVPVFVILTTAANDSMKPIHDRMPVIVQKEEWLCGNCDVGEIFAQDQPDLIAVEAS